ncbi:hypothetical protein V6O07_15490, partial [Arthrospira platensis SPKY2]
MSFVPITNVLNEDITAFNMEQRGNFDTAGRSSLNTLFGEGINTSRVDDVSVQFQYSISNYETVSYIDGTG